MQALQQLPYNRKLTLACSLQQSSRSARLRIRAAADDAGEAAETPTLYGEQYMQHFHPIAILSLVSVTSGKSRSFCSQQQLHTMQVGRQLLYNCRLVAGFCCRGPSSPPCSRCCVPCSGFHVKVTGGSSEQSSLLMQVGCCVFCRAARCSVPAGPASEQRRCSQYYVQQAPCKAIHRLWFMPACCAITSIKQS